MRIKRIIIALGILASASTAFANLSLTSSAMKNGGDFPYHYGYCQPNEQGTVKISDDISPPLSWSDAPKATQSYALVLMDPSASSSADFDVKGKMVPKDKERMSVFHWVVANIPASQTHMPEGAGSKGFKAGGKKPGQTAYGLMGTNVYTGAFSSPYASRITFSPHKVNDMKGIYGQYDGPCAPWNDNVIHNYTFTLYALDVPALDLPADGHFTGQDLLKAMKGHIIGQASLAAAFITNPVMIKMK